MCFQFSACGRRMSCGASCHFSRIASVFQGVELRARAAMGGSFDTGEISECPCAGRCASQAGNRKCTLRAAETKGLAAATGGSAAADGDGFMRGAYLGVRGIDRTDDDNTCSPARLSPERTLGSKGVALRIQQDTLPYKPDADGLRASFPRRILLRSSSFASGSTKPFCSPRRSHREICRRNAESMFLEYVGS